MKKLFMDLEKLYTCKDITAECSYFYRDKNYGVNRLRELAQFLYICRRCENAPCINACPKEALDKDKDGMVKRYTMRCISCKSCSLSCPFGIIPDETVPYITSQCDACIDRSGEEAPICVRTCPIEGVLEFKEAEASEKGDIFLIGKHIAVHAKPWKKYHP